MDDPQAIAERFRTVARTIVADTAAVAEDAFAMINKDAPTNPPPEQADNGAAAPPAPPKGGAGQAYTAGEAVKTLSSLFKVAVTGAINLARVPLQSQPENQPMLMADHLGTVAARSAADVDRVAQDAAALIDRNAFTQNQWVDTAIKLTSIAMIRGAEVIETVGAGPGRYGNPAKTSDPIVVAADADNDRELKVLNLGRPGVKDEDITALVRFGPADAIVVKGTETFLLRGKSEVTLTVNAAGIPSGLYLGTISIAGAEKSVTIAL
ncbi:hypothetical protein BH10ACT9_BH10ACT9_46350 [soil metagenome]